MNQSLSVFLEPPQRELIEDSLHLIDTFHCLTQSMDCPCRAKESSSLISDYAFLVFPAAKAYEGFLKLFFWRTRLISDQEYHGHSWRVGRSFNPDIPYKFRDEDWIYDDVAQLCSPDLAKDLWAMWLDGRNHLFHFFPRDRYVLSLAEAEKLVHRIVAVMEEALACEVKLEQPRRRAFSPSGNPATGLQ
jgi:hypothetical protein